MSFQTHVGERFARMALAGVHREYPNQVALVMTSDADARPPRELTPAFFGCYDWHSAVHGHWCLVRLVRHFPNADWAQEARNAIGQSLTATNLQAELKYLQGSGRDGFERPYGLAWLLQLAAELHEWDDSDAKQWLDELRPLAQLAVDRLSNWLAKLNFPIRSGEHSQSAFAMGLSLDFARCVADRQFERLLERRTLDFHRHDRLAPLSYEPSGHDFVSPCLAEADLMRRVLGPPEFAVWLGEFLPIPSGDWLSPVTITDCDDGKLAHLVGLNLSRAWMLEGIAAGLPIEDARQATLLATADRHRQAGIDAVSADHYAVAHWVGSFAVYLLTQRGCPQNRNPLDK
ncbi:MAG: DUF2891 domain-containing protein [Planctomycetota bacterium]|nr:DUF2891 domain-containing protein [Planctomycetota bacterium]